MTSSSLRGRARRTLVLGLLAAVAAPAGAHAAGFGAPVVVSGRDDADQPQVAVAPTGRTAVLWYRTLGHGKASRYEYRIALGGDPAHLAPPSTLLVDGHTVNPETDHPVLLAALGDGSVLLCLEGETTNRCVKAPPAGGFAPFSRLPGIHFGVSAAARPDGSIVLVLDRGLRNGGDELSSAVVSPAGVVGPRHVIRRSAGELQLNASLPQPVAADDGTVAIPAGTPGDPFRAPVHLGLRLMAPGADAFGPVVHVPGDGAIATEAVHGGPAITLEYSVSRSGGLDGPRDRRFVQRHADGTFGEPLALPGAAAGDVTGALTTLPGGELLAIASRVDHATDGRCANPVGGTLSVGPLVAATGSTSGTPISTPGQIPLSPQAATLADGTVVAAWENGISRFGLRRMEVTVRPAGATAFGPGQRLAGIGGASDPVLASGGQTAALAWAADPADPTSNRHRIVLSDYRTAPPFAAQAPLAKHPATACDE